MFLEEGRHEGLKDITDIVQDIEERNQGRLAGQFLAGFLISGLLSKSIFAVEIAVQLSLARPVLGRHLHVDEVGSLTFRKEAI